MTFSGPQQQAYMYIYLVNDPLLEYDFFNQVDFLKLYFILFFSKSLYIIFLLLLLFVIGQSKSRQNTQVDQEWPSADFSLIQYTENGDNDWSTVIAQKR